jgi:hypothetical protein
LIHDVCWQKEPAGTADPLSVDLRKRVVDGVGNETSRRPAARSFRGRVERYSLELAGREERRHCAQADDGDRRSAAIEAQANQVLLIA